MVNWKFWKKAEQTATAANETVDERIFDSLKILLLDRSNPDLNEHQLLDEVHRSPIFYACVSLIASQMASTDIYVKRNGERDDKHEVSRRLENPNIYHSKYTFLWLVAAYLVASGNSYVFVMPSGELIPVAPTKVTHMSNDRYQVEFGYSTFEARLNVNLIKLTMPDLREPYISGTGYGSVLSREIDISKAAQQHELATLKNNARPDLLVNLQGVQPNDLKAVKDSWDKAHAGVNNSGKTAFLSASNMTALTLGSSFKDLGFVDLREFSNDTIRRTFGVPPELLGKSENSNRATIESAFYLFAMTVLKPRLEQLTSELNKKLLPVITRDRTVKLCYDDPVPENDEFKLTVMREFPQAFSINEVRQLAGFPQIVGGDATMDGQPVEPEPQEMRVLEPTRPILPMLRIGSQPEELYFAQLESEMRRKRG